MCATIAMNQECMSNRTCCYPLLTDGRGMWLRLLFSRKYSGVCVGNKERDQADSDYIARPDQNARAALPKQPQDAVVSANDHAVASLATVTLLLTARAHPQRRTNFQDGRVSILLCFYLLMEPMPIREHWLSSDRYVPFFLAGRQSASVVLGIWAPVSSARVS